MYRLGFTVLEFTGDAAPDAAALKQADVIITTPEKWDGVTRGWKTRPYVARAALLIMDEVRSYRLLLVEAVSELVRTEPRSCSAMQWVAAAA